MALSKPVYSTSYVEDMLQCSVCLETVTDAHTLQQCFHTFCKLCVDDLIKRQHNPRPGLQCPMCRCFSGKDEIRNNFFINDLAQMHRSLQGQQRKPICEQCAADNPVDAEWKCLDCKMDICQACQISHLKIKMLQGHRILPITEDTELVVDKLVFCNDHDDEPIKLYCTECQIPICMKCKATDHDRHKSETIEKALQRLVPDMEDGVQFLDSHLQTIGKSVDEVDAKMVEAKKSFEDCRKDIDKTTEERIQELKANQKKLKDAVNQQEKEEIGKLQNTKLNLQGKQKEVGNLQKVIKTSLERARQATLLTELIQGGLCGKLQSMKEKKEPPVSLQLSQVKLDKRGSNWNQLKQEGLVGKLDCKMSKMVLQIGAVSFSKDAVGSRYWSCDFKEYFSKPLRKCNEVIKLPESYHFAITNDKIWVPCFDGGVKIFDMKGAEVHSLNIQNPVSAESTIHGDVFIACHTEGGLFVHSTNDTLKKLCEGSFSDVCRHEEDMYALEYGNKRVIKFQVDPTTSDEDRSWKQVKQVQLNNYQSQSSLNTLIVQQVNEKYPAVCFYVAEFNGGNVKKYDENGTMVQKFQCDYPFLCGFDNCHRLLVANYIGHKLMCFDTKTGLFESHQMLKELNLGYPSDIKLDKEGFVWVQISYGIHKYQIQDL